jgi:hypothetical protein
LLPFPLPFEELEVTGRALESGEAAGTAAAALESPATIDRGDRRPGADDAPEDEGAKAAAPLLAVHALILRSS